jgi:3-hydroxybutyryl-CoA dehydrogenase
MDISSIGVVGAGVIGVGVAQNLAQTGHRVILLDQTPGVLDKAQQAIRNNIRFQSFFSKDKKGDHDADATLEKITFTTDLSNLAAVEFVIENVPEKWELKQEVYGRLDSVCPARAIFGANTSAIPITRIAALTGRPAQVIGIHFMNPVPLKSTVEVIRGYHTSDETLAATQSLLGRMGKQGIVVKDSPGFVSNRVLMLTINEAIFLAQEQVASVEDIDRIFTTCFGHKMGPLATADLIGLDTILYSIEVLYDSFNDGKYRPCPLLRQMVDAGLYGRKSGRGFYTYGEATQG